MIRRIIQIDQEKCNGCCACAAACHEDAIAMVDGKAKLIRDDYCDGLGDCLPSCPTGAISFVEREAAEYNEAEVKRVFPLFSPLGRKAETRGLPVNKNFATFTKPAPLRRGLTAPPRCDKLLPPSVLIQLVHIAVRLI